MCNHSVSPNKEFNIKRQFDMRHNKYDKFNGQTRKSNIARLKTALKKHLGLFNNYKTETKKSIKALLSNQILR